MFYRRAFRCSATDTQCCVQYHLLPGIWRTFWVHWQTVQWYSSKFWWCSHVTGTFFSAGESVIKTQHSIIFHIKNWHYSLGLCCKLLPTSHLIWDLSSYSALQHVSLVDEVAAWSSSDDIHWVAKGDWLCWNEGQRAQEGFWPFFTKRLHRLFPHRDGRGEYVYSSVSSWPQFLMKYINWRHKLSFVLMIGRGQRFWFWHEEFVCLHSGLVWSWNWNYNHNFTLGTVVHDLLPSHTRCLCCTSNFPSLVVLHQLCLISLTHVVPCFHCMQREFTLRLMLLLGRPDSPPWLTEKICPILTQSSMKSRGWPTSFLSMLSAWPTGTPHSATTQSQRYECRIMTLHEHFGFSNLGTMFLNIVFWIVRYWTFIMNFKNVLYSCINMTQNIVKTDDEHSIKKQKWSI